MMYKRLIPIVVAVLLTACGNNPSTAFTAGVEALQNSEWGKADSLFTVIISTHPDDGDALNNRAIARKELGLLDAALSDSKEAVLLDAENELYQLTLGELLFAKGMVTEAAERAQIATTLAPDNPNTWYFLGSVRMAQGDTEGAIRSLRKSLDIDGSLLIAAQQIIAAYIMAGRYDKALYESNKLINAGMPDAINLRNRAYAYLLSGDPAAALTDLNKALLIDSTDAIAWNNKCRALLQLGNKEEAYSALTNAFSYDPDNPFIEKHRALYLLATGDTSAACEYLTGCAYKLRQTWPAYMVQADSETDSLLQLVCVDRLSDNSER